MKTTKKVVATFCLLFCLTTSYGQNWQLVWHDEFDNSIGPDWVFETGAGGWGNNEFQFYRKENASVQNGNLVLSVKQEAYSGANYTSVRMTTQGKKSWKFGKIEARIAVPAIQGIWPAFWMLGDKINPLGWPACGEIDIMEHVNTGNTNLGTIHWEDNGHAQYGGSTEVNNITTFHNYAVTWDANFIKWYVDDVKYHEVSIANGVNSTSEFAENFFLLLNIAVGGNLPGNTINNGALPAQMLVDYVRVYQDMGNTTPSSTGLVTTYDDCNYAGFSAGLDIGDYNVTALSAKGIRSNVISALKIKQGYKAILFDGDNFDGASTILTADSTCLESSWNDKVSSIQIRANGATNLAGTYALQNRNSGLNMDVDSNGGTTNGGNIQQWAINNTATNQQFKLEHLGDGVYKITGVYSGKSLDIANLSKVDGANVQQWTYSGSANQQFILVPTDSGYYKIIAKHSGKIVEVAGYSLTNGANVQQWENVNQSSGQWKLNSTATSFSALIQAENYSSMSGVQTEATSDTNLGLNVAYMDTGDWMAYSNITFPTTGTYVIEYRVASAITGSKFSTDLNAGTIVLGSLTVPNTGGWQNWQTISQTVNINAGSYSFGVFIQNSGVNLNWIRITKVSTARIAQIQEKTLESIIMYPNPVVDELHFDTDMSGIDITVYNIAGTPIILRKIKEDSFDISNLKSGMYYIALEKEGQRITKRFVKK